MKITLQEAHLAEDARGKVIIPEFAHEICEQVAFEARANEFVDQKSGVSARLSISAFENYHSAVEWRMLMNRESTAIARIADLDAIIPSITGKVELVYEGEQEGPLEVARQLLGSAVRSVFLKYFPSPEKRKTNKEGKPADPYAAIVLYFESGKLIELGNHEPEKSFRAKLYAVNGLAEFVENFGKPEDEADKYFMMEWVLHALANFSRISKRISENGTRSFGDFMSSVFNS
jgi:magnesium chelatase subunit I